MKNIIIFLLVAIFAAFAFASDDWGKGGCSKRAPDVQKAIERYCRPHGNSGGFMIPGIASSSAKRVGKARVSIDGGCNPAQWLPWDICFKQFYSMCNSGPITSRGNSYRVYGNDGCQKWNISNQ